MSAWRHVFQWSWVACLVSACAVQPLTPGPADLAAVAEVAVLPDQPTILPAAPVVQVATEPVLSQPTATPPLPTPLPYLTPTPITPTAVGVIAADLGSAALAQPTRAVAVGPTQAPPVVVVVTDTPASGGPDPTATIEVSVPTATAGVAAAPPEGDAYAAAVYMVDLINQQRAAAGIAPLVRDPLLMSVAQGRVDDMVARGYTGHNDPATGESLGPVMIRAAGFTSNFVGENWYGTIKAPPANVETAMAWFMTDPPHARNILSPYYAYVGVGLAFNGRQWLIVQNFAGLN